MGKKIAFGLVGLVVFAGAVFVFLFLNSKPASTPSVADKPQEQTKAEPAKPAKVIVTLPGAQPVDARVEDYNDPKSIWTVVSKDHPLPDQQYRPTDLKFLSASRTDKSSDERSLRSVVVDDFTTLISDAKIAGYDLIIGSGFRSYDLQAYYYNHYVSVSGEAQANKFSAKPGQSEHQTGLAFDVTLSSRECYLDTCFGDTSAGKWVAANAYKYGFIVRYPADKTEITKYQYEPWHLRYVGKDLALAIKTSGLTLDEAYPYLQQARAELLKQNLISVQ